MLPGGNFTNCITYNENRETERHGRSELIWFPHPASKQVSSLRGQKAHPADPGQAGPWLQQVTLRLATSTHCSSPATSVSLGPLAHVPSTHLVISARKFHLDNKDFLDTPMDAEQHPGGTCKSTVKVNNYFLILYA